MNNNSFANYTRISRLFSMVLFLLSLTASAQIEVESPQQEATYANDVWHVSASPYLWLAGLDGDLNLSGHEAAVHQSFGDIFSNLKVGFMGLGEVRRGRVGVLTDLLFVRVGDQGAVPVPQLPFPVQAKLTSTTFTLTPEFAYRVYSQKHFAADVVGGFRFSISVRIQVSTLDRLASFPIQVRITGPTLREVGACFSE
jgi:hypothetical protein